MAIQSTDVTFTLSGGSSNSDPDASLGGESSVIPISGQRLFSDVTPEESTAGLIDYRCFYLHNENVSDSLHEASLAIIYTAPGPVVVQLGFYSSRERQVLTVLNSSSITSGSLELTYTDATGDHDFTVNWNSDSSIWAAAIQAGLNAISGLEDVIVTDYAASSNITFEIEFFGTSDLRFHDLLAVKTNSLSPTTSVGISRAVAGGPINSESDEIDVSTTIPNGIVFIDDSEFFDIGELKSLDSVPIWVKRTVPEGTEASESDGFTFRLSGKPVA